MISIRLVGKERKIVGIVDDNTPVPHTLARITEVSTNYGLADEARILYPELVRKTKEEEAAAFNMAKMAKEVGAVGGPYKEKETDEEIIVNIGDYVESVASSDDEESNVAKTSEVSDAQLAALASSASSYKKVLKGAAGGAGGGAKTNGYCLFIKHIARKNKAVGCLSELMAKFDKDWKMLPNYERAQWKIRAKSGDGGRGRPDSSHGRGLERYNASVAPTLGPRGRGRGRGRGWCTPGKVDNAEDDDEYDY